MNIQYQIKNNIRIQNLNYFNIIKELFRPEPSLIIACSRIVLVLIPIGFGFGLAESFYHRHVVGRPVPGLEARSGWFFIGFAVMVAPILETAVMAVLARLVGVGRRPGLFVVLTAALAALTHPPLLLFKTTLIALAFTVMAIQMVVWSRERTATFAFWGVVTTHTLYNAGLLTLVEVLDRVIG